MCQGCTWQVWNGISMDARCCLNVCLPAWVIASRCCSGGGIAATAARGGGSGGGCSGGQWGGGCCGGAAGAAAAGAGEVAGDRLQHSSSCGSGGGGAAAALAAGGTIGRRRRRRRRGRCAGRSAGWRVVVVETVAQHLVSCKIRMYLGCVWLRRCRLGVQGCRRGCRRGCRPSAVAAVADTTTNPLCSGC